MEFRAQSFPRLALGVGNILDYEKGQKRHALAGPAPCFAVRDISNQQYLPRDEDSMETRRSRCRVVLLESRTEPARSRADYGKQKSLQVAKLRNVRAGKKLFVEYGMRYPFV